MYDDPQGDSNPRYPAWKAGRPNPKKKEPHMRDSLFLMVVPAGVEPALLAWEAEWERIPPDFITF